MFPNIDGLIGSARDSCGGTTQVHRHEDLNLVLPWDQTAPDHGLYDKDANNG